jgi:hypothetical protein
MGDFYHIKFKIEGIECRTRGICSAGEALRLYRSLVRQNMEITSIKQMRGRYPMEIPLSKLEENARVFEP